MTRILRFINRVLRRFNMWLANRVDRRLSRPPYKD